MAENSARDAQAAANKLSSKIARVQLTEDNALGEVFGSRMFRVKAGWEVEQLKSERSVAQVISVMQLREAMEDATIDSIFIPRQSALTMDAAKHVLQQSSQDKTLFWEA
jgi:hypothetical protein